VAAPKKTLKFRSSRTREFDVEFASLPKAVQATASKAFRLWLEDPSHTSLTVHKLKGQHEGKWAVTVNWSYRAVYKVEEIDGIRTYWWLWIGTHEAYNKLFRK